MSKKNLSLIYITRQRTELLKRSLASVERALQFLDPARRAGVEVLVGINGPDRGTERMLECFKDAPSFKIFPSPGHLLPGAARNRIIEKATGDWIYFFDDDVEIAPDHLQKFFDLRQLHPGLDVIGGPNRHLQEMTDAQRAQEFLLTRRLWAGPFAQRYSGGKQDLRVTPSGLILCNLALKKTAQLEFSENLRCAEENELLSRYRSEGRRMGFFPELCVHHERRSDLSGFWQQIQKMGTGRGQILRRSFPGAIFLSLLFLILFVFSFFYLPLFFVWSLGPARRDKIPARLLFVAGGTLHWAYFFGVTRGLMDSRL